MVNINVYSQHFPNPHFKLSPSCHSISKMATSPDGVYEKGVIDPGLPVANSTKPYWLTEPSPIAKIQSPWLDEVDVAIIGSGMTALRCRTPLF